MTLTLIFANRKFQSISLVVISVGITPTNVSGSDVYEHCVKHVENNLMNQE